MVSLKESAQSTTWGRPEVAVAPAAARSPRAAHHAEKRSVANAVISRRVSRPATASTALASGRTPSAALARPARAGTRVTSEAHRGSHPSA